MRFFRETVRGEDLSQVWQPHFPWEMEVCTELFGKIVVEARAWALNVFRTVVFYLVVEISHDFLVCVVRNGEIEHAYCKHVLRFLERRNGSPR